MEHIKEIAAYVAANVEDYEARLQVALGVMDRMRCPLRMADPNLYWDIENCVSEWADSHDFSVDYLEGIDVEEILWEA